MIFLDSFEELTRNNRLTGNTWAVLIFILSKSKYDNFVELNQGEIAQHIGIARQNVSKAIKLLVEKDLIIKGPKIGTRNTYTVNWQYAWRGTTASYREAQRQSIARKLEIVK